MKKWKLSLVWKISIFMTVIISVLILVVCIVYLQTFTMSAREDAARELEQSLIKVEQNIVGNLENAQSFLNDLFYKQEFPYFMNDKNILSESEMNYYISSLESSLIKGRSLYNNMFGDFWVYSSNRQIGENKGYHWQFYMDTLKKKAYYGEIMSNPSELVYGKVRNMDLVSTALKTDKLNMGDSQNQILPLYRKVYDLNTKEVIGVVEIDLDVARLSDSANLESERGNRGIMVLDDSQNVLVDTFQSSQGVIEEIKGVIKRKAGTETFSHGGGRYMVSYHTLKDTNLITVSIVNQENLQKFLRTRIVQVCGVCILCLLVMFGIVYYFMHNMLKRLVILDDMMGKVREGDFGVVIADDNVEDEVTRITRSFNEMSIRLNKVIEEKVQYEQAQKEAELKALQAQINPHFLYNTLENMRMQCEIDEYYSLGNSLSALGELFRYSISWGADEVRFELEWKNLKNYTSIMLMRYGDSVEFVLEKDDNLDDMIVPKFIIQPLVENCFNHGFKNKIPPWEVSISAKKRREGLVITITDNGNGIEPERLARLQKCIEENRPFRSEKNKKNSIGITNVKQRIRLICKPGSTMHIESQVGTGTKIELIITE
ncbi:sensor histidine kinase [Muricomes intestini]|uniref:sensor histidine kinase n=1 Tax=Muricomes intestini TaxID=1796634 RepID=UPI002FDF02DC